MAGEICECSQYDYTCNCALEEALRELQEAQRCSDCAHFLHGRTDIGGNYVSDFVPEADCMRGHYAQVRTGHEDALRALLRTAASCDDYEEVDDSEEGVADADS